MGARCLTVTGPDTQTLIQKVPEVTCIRNIKVPAGFKHRVPPAGIPGIVNSKKIS